MDDEQDRVILDIAVYQRLIHDSRVLQALEAGGVDNWEWYSESLREAGLYGDEEEDDEDE